MTAFVKKNPHEHELPHDEIAMMQDRSVIHEALSRGIYASGEMANASLQKAQQRVHLIADE